MKDIRKYLMIFGKYDINILQKWSLLYIHLKNIFKDHNELHIKGIQLQKST